jgi:alpha-mannosidase
MFDWGQPDEPIMDNVCLTEMNVNERVEAFVRACKGLGNITRGDDIMLTMGTDFTYSNAHVWCAPASRGLLS